MRQISANQRKQPSAKTPVLPQITISSREWILIGLVLAIGMGLRLWALFHSAVEHFDEGVYASNLYFGPPDYAYPQQRFFGPPLLPALIEAGMIVGLPPNLAALLPSFLAGCATIVALWWFGRSWFGPEVGISAAALIALSDFHVVYSATALTDVLLGLWLVLAVDAIGRSLLHCDFRWAVAAGIYTGLAWWTKYNGWLPLAIEAVALPLLWLIIRPSPRRLIAWFGCLSVTALVAAAVWSPYFLSLQSQGGYGPIAANHAKYFVGFTGWLNAAARQISNQYAMETLQSTIAIAAALALPGLLARENVWSRFWRSGIGVGVGCLVLFWTSALVAGIGSLVGLTRAAFALHRAKPFDEESRRRAVGLILMIVWWGGLLVAVPCYTPYPRLALPWLLASWLGISLNGADFLPGFTVLSRETASVQLKIAACMAVLLSVFLVPMLIWPHDAHFVQSYDRRGLVQIAQQSHNAANGNAPRVNYVYGEPALLFQLRASGVELVAPVQNVPNQPATINEQPVLTFLIVGPHAEGDPHFQEQWAAVQGRWELLQTFDYTPSVVVWLDLHDPRKPADPPMRHEVRLYQLRP